MSRTWCIKIISKGSTHTVEREYPNEMSVSKVLEDAREKHGIDKVLCAWMKLK